LPNIRIAAGVLLFVVIAVLGYGYRFGATHGSLYISVMDVSDREHPEDVRPVQLSFLGSQGEVLAQAAGTKESIAIFISSPPTYSCREVEQRAPFSVAANEEWSRCFEQQSRWLPTWVRRAKAVDLRSNSCTIDRIPVSVSEHPDTWWLWWVPLRHIGGKPYTSFSFLILLDRNSCRASALRPSG